MAENWRAAYENDLEWERKSIEIASQSLPFTLCGAEPRPLGLGKRRSPALCSIAGVRECTLAPAGANGCRRTGTLPTEHCQCLAGIVARVKCPMSPNGPPILCCPTRGGGVLQLLPGLLSAGQTWTRRRHCRRELQAPSLSCGVVDITLPSVIAQCRA
jgi:hypothetical protein